MYWTKSDKTSFYLQTQEHNVSMKKLHVAFHTFTQKTSGVTLFLLALHYVINRVFIRQLYFTNYNPLIPIRCLFFASVWFTLIGYSHLKVKVTVCHVNFTKTWPHGNMCYNKNNMWQGTKHSVVMPTVPLTTPMLLK